MTDLGAKLKLLEQGSQVNTTIIVTESGFTKRALQLGRKTGLLLFTPDELRNWVARRGEPNGSQDREPAKISPFFSIQDAADYLAVDYKTIYRLVRAGKLPAEKVGGAYRIRRDVLETYVRSQADDVPHETASIESEERLPKTPVPGNTLNRIFGRRKRTTQDVSLDELTMAKVKLEQEQEQVLSRLVDLEQEKERLFQQRGNESSKRRQVLIAQKLQELEFQAKNYDKNLAAYQKQMRVLNGMIFLKENRKSWVDTPVGQVIGSMDLAELEGYVDRATANNVFQMDKFERLLSSLEESTDLSGHEEVDEGVAQVLSELERTRSD